MPAIANIVIADGQPTPVNRTFGPVGVDSNFTAFYENRASGLLAGYDRLSIGLRRATATSPRSKISVRLNLPKLDGAVPPAQEKVLHESSFFGEFVVPAGTTLQERDDLMRLVYNLFAAGGVVDTCVQNVESVY